jgi:hypothetical protein
MVAFFLLEQKLSAAWRSQHHHGCSMHGMAWHGIVSCLVSVMEFHFGRSCRTIPLKEQARRIAYQRSTRTFGVLTLSAAHDSSSFKVLVQGSWEIVAALQLQQDELGTSICSVTSQRSR